MNSIDVLRDSLDERAELADDGAGLLDDVRAGAARVRRRRRLMAVTGTLAAVVAAALVAPAALDRLDRPDPPAAPLPREMLQTNLTLDESAGLTVRGFTALAGLQRLDLGSGVKVEVHDPGPYDPALSRDATATDLGGGRSGLSIPAFTPQEEAAARTFPAVARRDPSGAWIVAYGDAGNDRLAAAAVAVRIGPPRAVTVPYRLGYLPTDLRVTSVQIDTSREPATFLNLVDGTNRLMLQVVTQHAPGGSAPVSGAPTRIGGHDAWYLTAANSTWFADFETEAAGMFVQTGPGCSFFLRATDGSVLTRDVLERMVREATFVSCTDRPAWTAPLG
jgi:hypothetical protein